MFGWLRPKQTQVPALTTRAEARLTLLENRFDDIDSRLEYLTTEIKKVRGRQFAFERAAAGDEEDPAPAPPAVGNNYSTAHLARRFRGE